MAHAWANYNPTVFVCVTTSVIDDAPRMIIAREQNKRMIILRSELCRTKGAFNSHWKQRG